MFQPRNKLHAFVENGNYAGPSISGVQEKHMMMFASRNEKLREFVGKTPMKRRAEGDPLEAFIKPRCILARMTVPPSLRRIMRDVL